MRLYTNWHGLWTGTQLDARHMEGGVHQFDVPTDKTSLLDFLNAHKVGGAPETPQAPQAAATLVPAATPEPTSGPTVSPRHALFEAAQNASLQDLQHVVYRYMMAIDNEFDLRKEGQA